MRLILSAAAVRHHLIMTLHNFITLLTIRSLLCATATYYVQALLLCATTLMERATRVVRAAAAATPQGVSLPDSCFRSSLLALLPAACAALSLSY